MSDLYQSLAHTKWDCKYHVVFVPKRRRRVIFGNIRQQLGATHQGNTPPRTGSDNSLMQWNLLSLRDWVRGCQAEEAEEAWRKKRGKQSDSAAIVVLRFHVRDFFQCSFELFPIEEPGARLDVLAAGK